MNTKLTLIAALATILLAIRLPAQDTLILNIDARISGSPFAPIGSPITHDFSAGVYTSTLISPADHPEATFSDWTPYAYPNDNLRLTAYAIATANATLVTTGGTNTLVTGAPGVAFAATTNKTVTFSLTNSTTLRFGVSDNVIGDNSGGVSLLITKQSIDGTNAVPVSIQSSSNQAVQVSWPTQPGQRYQVMWSQSLAPNSWLPLGIPQAAPDLNDSALDYTTNQSPRFYRVFQVQ